MKRIKHKNGTTVVETAHPFQGLANGDERLAKVKLAAHINEQIKKRGIKQTEAAALLGITQPEVSSLGKGRLSGFTFDRLYRCLNALDVDVEISVKKHSARSGTSAGVHVHT